MPLTLQELETNSSCFDCIPVGTQDAVLIYILARIAGVTDIPTLMAASACYDCIPVGYRKAVQIYLENLILSGGGTGGQEVFSGNYAGGVPTDVPTGAQAVAFDTSNGTLWEYYSGSWH